MYGVDGDVRGKLIEGMADEIGVNGLDGADSLGRLDGKTSNTGNTVAFVGSDGLNVGGDAGAGGGVETGDGQNDGRGGGHETTVKQRRAQVKFTFGGVGSTADGTVSRRWIRETEVIDRGTNLLDSSMLIC